MSKKTKAANTNTTSTVTPATMSMAPSHISQPQMFQGTRPGVTVEVEAPTADQLAAMASSPVPSDAPAPSGGGTKGGKAKKPAQTKPEAPAKAPRGPGRDGVVALLQATGLPLTVKSSDHWGGHTAGKTLKGPRLVLPKSAAVTRLFIYDMPDASTLLGYHTPEQRRSKGLGAVTHVADVNSLDQVKALIAAVCEANGIQLKQDGTPKAKRTKKATPAQGTPTTAESAAEAK